MITRWSLEGAEPPRVAAIGCNSNSRFWIRIIQYIWSVVKGISQAFLFKAKPYTMRNIASLKWSHSERPTSFTSILLALNRTSVFTVLSYGGGQPCEVSTLRSPTRLQMNLNLAVRGEVEIKRDVAANELGRSF